MVSQPVENSASAPLRKSPAKERVRFIFEPGRYTPNGITFTWLIHDAYEGKEKAAMAVRSFWLPIAYQESGKYSETELQELAQDCIWQMQEQIQFLRLHFNLMAPQRLPADQTNQRPKNLSSRGRRVSSFDLNPEIATDLMNDLMEVLG